MVESKAKYEAARLAWLAALTNVERLEAAMKAAEKELEIATIGQQAYDTKQQKLREHKQWVEMVCERYPQ
jgi:hypothetical protein